MPEKASTSRLLSRGRPDDFQTPGLALAPLVPFLPPNACIWEPSCGKGNIVRALQSHGFCVTGTDILQGQDFFDTQRECDVLVTNPPFSCKDEYLARCYALGNPFALLLPLTALEGRKRQELYRAHGLEIIFLDRRINFETPSGEGQGSWFATAWYTWGLNIGREITFACLPPRAGAVSPQPSETAPAASQPGSGSGGNSAPEPGAGQSLTLFDVPAAVKTRGHGDS